MSTEFAELSLVEWEFGEHSSQASLLAMNPGMPEKERKRTTYALNQTGEGQIFVNLRWFAFLPRGWGSFGVAFFLPGAPMAVVTCI